MKQPPLQTEEDLRLVKEYILLPILLDVLERDIQILKIVQLKMASIYVGALQHVQDKVMTDLAILRKRLREHGIKVFEQQRGALSVQAGYLCRGYEHKF